MGRGRRGSGYNEKEGSRGEERGERGRRGEGEEQVRKENVGEVRTKEGERRGREKENGIKEGLRR